MEPAPQLKPARRPSDVCPECGKNSVFRSRRRFPGDHLLSLIGLYPYRCRECDHRFHSRRRSAGRGEGKLRWARCPRCQSTEIDRISKSKVPPTWTNFLWRWVPVPAYRCPECRQRFYDIRPRKPAAAKES